LTSRDENIEAEAKAAQARDALGQAFFYLHFAVMIYIVAGWLVPSTVALWFYAAFLPLVTVQWWFNRNSCVLNNLESFLRTGRWRHAGNAEEGAWLRTLAHNALGLDVTPLQMDVFTYAVMAVLWALGIWHLLHPW